MRSNTKWNRWFAIVMTIVMVMNLLPLSNYVSVKAETVEGLILDDAFTQNSSADKIFAEVGNTPEKIIIGRGRHAYYRFNIGAITGNIASATLNLYKIDSNTNTLTYQVCDENLKTDNTTPWTDDTITYNNSPSVISDTTIFTQNVSGKNKFVAIDLSEIFRQAKIEGKSTVSIHIYTASGDDGMASEFRSSRYTADTTQQPYVDVTTTDDSAADDSAIVSNAINILTTYTVSVLNNTQVKEEFSLPVSIEGATISWNSDNSAISIDNNTGVSTVTRPVIGEEDSIVTVSATVSCGSVSDTSSISFTVIVPACEDELELAYEELLAQVVQSNLTIQQLLAANVNQSSQTISKDLALPVTLTYDTDKVAAVSWSSSNEEIVSNTGIVVRPSFEQENCTITLTATITLADQREKEVVIIVTVLKEGDPEASKTVEVIAAEDVYVHSGQTNTNYYQNAKLITGKERESYLKFDLTEIPADADSIAIRMYNTNTNSRNLILNQVSGDWSETTLTYTLASNLTKTEVRKFVSGSKDVAFTVDVTECVLAAKEAGNSSISFHMKRAVDTDNGNPSEFYSIHGSDILKAPTLVSYSEGYEDKVDAVIEKIREYDGRYLLKTGDIELNTVDSNGSTISWTSSDDKALNVTTGEIVRQSKEGNDIVVALTAVVNYQTVSKNVTITVTIPKEQVISPYLEDSLSAVIDYTQNSINNAVIERDEADVTVGALSYSLSQQMNTLLTEARQCLQDKNSTRYSSYIQTLIAKGQDFFSSGNVSDRIIKTSSDNNGNGNVLEYSTYRAKLSGLVWRANAILLVEPELYNESAKLALKEQISYAEAALEGTFEFPYSRTREFVVPRDDEAIQFITCYNVKMHNYSMSTYGLAPAIDWYESQYVLKEAMSMLELKPTYCTYLQSGQAAKGSSNLKTIVMGNTPLTRVGLLQFDLSYLPAAVKNAELSVYNYKSDSANMKVCLEEDDWNGEEIDFSTFTSKYTSIVSGNLITEFSPAAKDTERRVNITAAVASEQIGDEKISFTIDVANQVSYPIEFHGLATEDSSMRPKLVVTLDIINDIALEDKYKEVLQLNEELANQAVVGTEPGEYPSDKVQALKDEIALLKSAKESNNSYEIGAKMVSVQNAARDLRNSAVINQDGSIFFSDAEILELKSKINSDSELKTVYDNILAIANSYTKEQLEDVYSKIVADDIDGLNQEYKVWTLAKDLNFTSVAGTTQAYLEVRMAEDDYTVEGSQIGYAWLDNIVITPTTTSNLIVPNAGFEDEDVQWSFVQGTGTTGKIVTDYAYAGNKSLFIENAQAGATGYWKSDTFAMGQDKFSIAFSVKNDDKFNTGLEIIVHYLDENGTELGVSDPITKNSKSTVILDNAYASAYQACALAYAVENDVKYAELSKWYMMLFLDDHLQGIESWLVNGSRPDGYDNYGAVQEGRNAGSLATAYSLIKDSGVFVEGAEFYNDFISKVKCLLRDISDIRDRMEIPTDEVAVNATNWQTDMAIGSSMLGMAFFSEIDNAVQYIDNGMHILEGQLIDSVRADGGWPESIRYHVSTLSKMAAYANALRYVTGENWFSNNSPVNLLKMFRFLVEIQTPNYVDGNISTPFFGDDALTNGSEFAYMGLYWDQVVGVDDELAQQMFETWVKAGKPKPTFSAEENMIQNFFLNADYSNTSSWNSAYNLNLKSTDYAKDWGAYIFRNNYGTDKASYLSFMANGQEIGHNHYDELSFILYANSTPIVVDPGIESYFSSSKNTYTSSASHATVQFFNGSNYINTNTLSSDQTFATTQMLDSVSATVGSTTGGQQEREILYYKGDNEFYIVWDQISNAPSSTRFNLPVLAVKTPTVLVDSKKVLVEGFNNTNMEVTFLQGADNIAVDTMRGAPQLTVREEESNALVDVIRAENSTVNGNYLTILLPSDASDATTVDSEKIDTGNQLVQAYKLTIGDEIFFLVANESSEEVDVNLGVNTIYEVTSNKKVSGSKLSINPNEIKLYSNKATTVEEGGNNSNNSNSNNDNSNNGNSNNNTEIEETVDRITTSIVNKGKESNININVNEKGFELELKNATSANPFELKIELPSDIIIKQLKEELNNQVNIIITIPNSFVKNEKININDIILEKTILKAAKTNKKSITISLKNEDNQLIYQWLINNKDLQNSSINSGIHLGVEASTLQDNLDIKKALAKDSKNYNGVVISYAHKNKLAVQATSKVYIGELSGIYSGSKVYVYRYNESTNKLDTLKGGYGYVVDKDGYVSLDIITGGRYVILANKASLEVITSLLNQITIAKKYTLKKGKTSVIKVGLPSCLEQVNTKKDTTQFSCIGAVTITYTSSNKKVATVGKTSGKISAKKKGESTITATVVLYSGKVKKFKTTVIVK